MRKRKGQSRGRKKWHHSSSCLLDSVWGAGSVRGSPRPAGLGGTPQVRWRRSNTPESKTKRDVSLGFRLRNRGASLLVCTRPLALSHQHLCYLRLLPLRRPHRLSRGQCLRFLLLLKSLPLLKPLPAKLLSLKVPVSEGSLSQKAPYNLNLYPL